jgi:hypothetical protein
MVEVYWPDRGGECKLDDIERKDVGGRIPESLSDVDNEVEEK